jgi:5'-3' exonuclease
MINLYDGDLLCYRASSSCEPTKAKPFLEPPEVAIWRLSDMIERICIATNTFDGEFYLGGSDNFRYTIYPEYKANRKDKPKPTYLEACREQLVTQYGSSIVNGIETDDMLGIRQTQLDGTSRICSLDKDLLMIPGQHFNWVNQEFKLVSPLDGLKTFYKQLILGDKSDNIPGFDGALRGSCPKFIEKLQAPIDSMTEEIDMYNHVFGVYFDAQGNDDIETIMHRNAQLLHILKEEDKFWTTPLSVS